MMKHAQLYIFITCLLLFSACNQQQRKVNIVASITCNSGMVDPHFTQIGKVDHNIDGREYFYMNNNFSYILTFSMQGIKRDSISLSKLNRQLDDRDDQIRSVLFIGDDSVLTISDKHNFVSLTNFRGDVIQQVCLDSLLPDSLKYNNAFIQLVNNASPSFDSIILYPNYTGYNTSKRGYRFPSDSAFSDYFSTLYNSPALVIFKNLLSQKSSLTFFADDYYQKQSSIPYDIKGDKIFKYLGNSVFLLSDEQPLIYRFFGDNFKQSQIIKLDTKYKKDMGTIFHVEDVWFKRATSEAREMYDSYYKLRGRAFNIFYNEDKKSYYVLLGHALNDTKELESYGFYYRPFSVIVYNENFTKSREYVFPANKYCYLNAFMTNRGLMIQRKAENINLNNYGTQTFDLLDFE